MDIDEGGIVPRFGIGRIKAFDDLHEMTYPRHFISWTLPLPKCIKCYEDPIYSDAIHFGKGELRFAFIIQEFPDKPSRFEFYFWLSVPKPEWSLTLLQRVERYAKTKRTA